MPGVIQDSQLSASKQDVIATLVQKELISESTILPTVMDVSRFAVKGAKQIEFPRRTSFSAEDRASGDEGTRQQVTFATDALTLDQVANVTWLVDPQDEVESVVDLDSELAQMAARAHAVYVEQNLRDELEAGGIPLPSGTTGSLTDSIVLEMKETLIKNKADRNRLRMVVSPSEETSLFQINKFVTADNVGDQNQKIIDGQIGRIYGVPIFVSTEMTGKTYYMYEESGIAVGFQRSPQMDERKAPENGAGAMLKTLEQKFGSKAMHIGEQSAGAGESALIVKDVN